MLSIIASPLAERPRSRGGHGIARGEHVRCDWPIIKQSEA
jgi:hypothetical protein